MTLALIALAKNPRAEEFQSTIYLKGSGEALALLCIISWVITLISRPEVVFENPLKSRIGYNNVCAGFDSSPARYFAQTLWPGIAYMNFRFAWIEVVTELHVNSANTSRTGRCMTVAACVLFAGSTCVLGLIFVISPMDPWSVWVHSLAFHQYIYFRLCVVVVYYFRNRYDQDSSDWDNINVAQWHFLYIYAFLSIVLPVMAIMDFYYYDVTLTTQAQKTSGPLLPWWLTCTVDYAWFVCLPLTTKYLPAQRILKLHFDSAVPHTEAASHEVTPLHSMASE